MKFMIQVGLLTLTSGVVQAECAGPEIRFVESAPRDRFEITIGDHPLRAVTVDLDGSAGRLIFDTEAGGTGVEVFQPLRDEGGTQTAPAADGATRITVGLLNAAPGTRAAFSIDVDDRLDASELGQIRVTGSEIVGAVAIFEGIDGSVSQATFYAANRAGVCP